MLPISFFEFLANLSANNNRDWFNSHKREFESSVRTPFLDLVEEVIARMQVTDPLLITTAKESVFRIYRDIRFSKDKTPYKTHMSAHITNGRRAESGPLGLYFEVHATGGNIGGGVYQPSSAQVTLIRDLLMHEGNTLRKICSAKSFTTHFRDGLTGEKSKILPAEFKVAAQKEPLLYNKQWLWFASVDIDVFTSSDAAKTIAAYHKAAKPISDFFEKALT